MTENCCLIRKESNQTKKTTTTKKKNKVTVELDMSNLSLWWGWEASVFFENNSSLAVMLTGS